MVGLPDTFQISLGRDNTRSIKLEEDRLRKPERTQDGNLTVEGREQLLRGDVVCSPLDVRAESNSLTRSVVGTYEIGWLVALSIWLSQRLNKRLGVTQNHIDLRVLADYRNLVFFSIISYIMLKLFLTGVFS